MTWIGVVETADKTHNGVDIVFPVEEVDLFPDGFLLLRQIRKCPAIFFDMNSQGFVDIKEYISKTRPSRPAPEFSAAEDSSTDRWGLDEIGVVEKLLGQADQSDESVDDAFVVQENIDADQVETDAAFQLEG